MQVTDPAPYDQNFLFEACAQFLLARSLTIIIILLLSHEHFRALFGTPLLLLFTLVSALNSWLKSLFTMSCDRFKNRRRLAGETQPEPWPEVNMKAKRSC